MHVLAPGNSEASAHGKRSKEIEEELKGNAKADAATRRMKEYQDRAAAKGTKRTNTSQ